MSTKYLLTVVAALSWFPAFATEIPADLAKAVKDYDEAQVQGNGTELQRLSRTTTRWSTAAVAFRPRRS